MKLWTLNTDHKFGGLTWFKTCIELEEIKNKKKMPCKTANEKSLID